ncbi:hypothetical protein, variant 2 [Cryptococcus amylolentus CBS 6039]|uniref:Exosome complex component CSL4 C-terminal domain-containing protein n=1 Tax=Cryptococcus amylolentus CBS 6039 TaxID=1295533 RepID=A0A1E3HDG1_9TREE|nr:hypothetical protein, variant 2 [Cryptococcus amylolentus CBS 6039]ODN74389.1 hypothetical protein, variant 2 [Cryptococcus amylolentus CBS 6039]
MSQAAILLPGQPLPPNLTAPPLPKAGRGCYEHNGQILASVVGRPRRDGAVVSVVGREEAVGIVDVDAIVIGTVHRLTPQQAHLTLTTLADRALPESSEEFTGVIRLTDIRLTERDKIKVGECFRLGDIVKAKVVSVVADSDTRAEELTEVIAEFGRCEELLPHDSSQRAWCCLRQV